MINVILICIIILIPKISTAKNINNVFTEKIEQAEIKSKNNRESIRFLDDKITEQKKTIELLKKRKIELPKEIEHIHESISVSQAELFTRTNNHKHFSLKRINELRDKLEQDRIRLERIEKEFYEIDAKISKAKILLSNNQIQRENLIQEYKTIRIDKKFYKKLIKEDDN